MHNNGLQKAIDQIGLDVVRKSMGDIGIAYCDVHGSHTYDMVTTSGHLAPCPLCPHIHGSGGNGVTATSVEHYINVSPIQSLDNPQQKINPMGL